MMKRVIVGFTILFALIAAIFGFMGYPVNGSHDGVFFLPPAVNFSLGNGLTNPIPEEIINIGDPTGDSRFLFYPPLFPQFVSAFITPLFPVPLPQQALLVLGILNALALGLSSFILYKIAKREGRELTWFSVALIALSLFIILRTSWSFGGRPEVLARILVVLAMLAVLYIKKPWMLVVPLSVLLGLMSGVHPAGAIMFGLMIGCYFAFQYETKLALRYAAVTCLSSIAVFFVSMQFSPFSLADAFIGLYRHSYLTLGEKNLGESFGAIIANPYALAYGVVMVFSFAALTHFFITRRGMIKAPILFSLIALALAVATFSLVVVELKNYYLTFFAPLVFTLLIYYLVHFSSEKLLRHGVIGGLALLSLLALKPLILSPYFVGDGVSIGDARAMMRKVAEEYPDANFIITSHLWPLSEDYSNMRLLSGVKPSDNLKNSVILLEQENTGTPTPPEEMKGCPLAQNFFVPNVPAPFGSFMPGYGFAVYDCRDVKRLVLEG